MLAAVVSGGLAGCAGKFESVGDQSTRVPESPDKDPRRENTQGPRAAVGFTHIRPDGNRVVPGKGKFPEVSPVDVPLDIVPAWVVGRSIGEDSVWIVVGESGSVRGIRLQPDSVQRFNVPPGELPAGFPPVVEFDELPRVIAPLG